jgi:hypothetical protein
MFVCRYELYMWPSFPLSPALHSRCAPLIPQTHSTPLRCPAEVLLRTRPGLLYGTGSAPVQPSISSISTSHRHAERLVRALRRASRSPRELPKCNEVDDPAMDSKWRIISATPVPPAKNPPNATQMPGNTAPSSPGGSTSPGSNSTRRRSAVERN